MFESKDPTVRVAVDLTARRIAVAALRQRDDFVEAFGSTGYPTV